MFNYANQIILVESLVAKSKIYHLPNSRNLTRDKIASPPLKTITETRDRTVTNNKKEKVANTAKRKQEKQIFYITGMSLDPLALTVLAPGIVAVKPAKHNGQNILVLV